MITVEGLEDKPDVLESHYSHSVWDLRLGGTGLGTSLGLHLMETLHPTFWDKDIGFQDFSKNGGQSLAVRSSNFVGETTNYS